jgi:hypothetical protein
MSTGISVQQSPADLVVSLPLDADAPRAARHHIALVDHPSPDLRDVIVLLTSELISQAVNRCRFAGVSFDLRAWMPPDLVRVEIRLPKTFLDLGWADYEQDLSTIVIRTAADRLWVGSEGDLARKWFEIDRH